MTRELLYKFKVQRSQRGKNSKNVNNSAVECAIWLKFRIKFDQMTLDASRTFKVN